MENPPARLPAHPPGSFYRKVTGRSQEGHRKGLQKSHRQVIVFDGVLLTNANVRRIIHKFVYMLVILRLPKLPSQRL